MKILTVETIGGDIASINADHVTHLTVTGLGTQVHFSSSEKMIVAEAIDELTLMLAGAVT